MVRVLGFLTFRPLNRSDSFLPVTSSPELSSTKCQVMPPFPAPLALAEKETFPPAFTVCVTGCCVTVTAARATEAQQSSTPSMISSFFIFRRTLLFRRRQGDGSSVFSRPPLAAPRTAVSVSF